MDEYTPVQPNPKCTSISPSGSNCKRGARWHEIHEGTSGTWRDHPGDSRDQRRKRESDRLLAEHDRAAAERVWDSCAQEAWESELIGHKKRDRLMAKNPYRITEENN